MGMVLRRSFVLRFEPDEQADACDIALCAAVVGFLAFFAIAKGRKGRKGLAHYASRITHHVSLLLLEKIPFFAMSLAMCWITVVAQERSGALAELGTVPMHSRLANALVSYVRYLEKAFWPQGLVVHYPRVLEWPLWQVSGAAL